METKEKKFNGSTPTQQTITDIFDVEKDLRFYKYYKKF